MPEGAKANTKAGAIAFVRYYVELINHAQATGDVDTLASVESARCKSCRDGRKYIRDVYDNGGNIEGGDLRIKIRDALKNAAVAGWTVDASLSYGPQTIVQPTASPATQHLDGGGVPITVIVTYGSGTWTISEWTRAR
jgi:hypothetical protein